MVKILLDEVEYKRLLRCEEVLQALRAAGVSDWEWYEAAMETLTDESL